MSSFLELETELLDYKKSMLEAGKAKAINFEAWGKGLCKRMVCFSSTSIFLFIMINHSASTTKWQPTSRAVQWRLHVFYQMSLSYTNLFPCCSWLELGGKILFAQYQAKVEAMEQQLEETRKQEEEEQVREAAVEARVEGFQERWQALAEAHHWVLGEF
jgi:hypothetical protein